jgi:hypothetical protein
MIAGYPPFFDENPFGIYQKILAGKIDFPKNYFDEASKSIITKLLVQESSKRLGCLAGRCVDVMKHKFFKSIDFNAVAQRKLRAPFVPPVRGDDDNSMFDRYPESNDAAIPSVSARDQADFASFHEQRKIFQVHVLVADQETEEQTSGEFSLFHCREAAMGFHQLGDLFEGAGIFGVPGRARKLGEILHMQALVAASPVESPDHINPRAIDCRQQPVRRHFDTRVFRQRHAQGLVGRHLLVGRRIWLENEATAAVHHLKASLLGLQHGGKFGLHPLDGHLVGPQPGLAQLLVLTQSQRFQMRQPGM